MLAVARSVDRSFFNAPLHASHPPDPSPFFVLDTAPAISCLRCTNSSALSLDTVSWRPPPTPPPSSPSPGARFPSRPTTTNPLVTALNSITSAMASLRLRRDDPALAALSAPRPLRIVASGTLFLTQHLTVSSYPTEGSGSGRARAVTMSRGGAASNVLGVLTQFAGVDAMLVAPLGGNTQGKMLINELEKEGVSTRYCKVWNGANVPCAWILASGMFLIF